MNNAIFFLTFEPNQPLLEFANEIVIKTDLEVFIIVDNNKYIPEKKYEKLIVKIDDDICYKNNFKNANFIIKKKVTSWDKVLFYLCRKKKDIDFCWIVEDDVFIPSVESVKELTIKYDSYDLVVAGDESNISQNRSFWHWKMMPKYMESKFPTSSLEIKNHDDKSWFKSMVCAIGVSRRLLYLINLHVLAYKELMFIEFMFNTISHQVGLNIKVLKNFDTIVWRHNWTESDILSKPNNWYHPIKDFSLHPTYRKLIKKVSVRRTKLTKRRTYTPKSLYAKSKMIGKNP
jgi:hypothetical protein